jgi:hypothetical protein
LVSMTRPGMTAVVRTLAVEAIGITDPFCQ